MRVTRKSSRRRFGEKLLVQYRRPLAIDEQAAWFAEALEPRLLLSNYSYAQGASLSGAISPSGPLVSELGLLIGTTSTSPSAVFDISPTTGIVSNISLTFTSATGEGAINGLIADPQGDLFGETDSGGSHGVGTVFEIPAVGGYASIVPIYNFAAGALPTSQDLICDSNGNIFVLQDIDAGTLQTSILEIPRNANGTYGSATTIYTLPSGTNLQGNIAIDSSDDIFFVATAFTTANSGGIYEIPALDGTDASEIDTLPTVPTTNFTGLWSDSSGDVFTATNDEGTLATTYYELYKPGTAGQSLLLLGSLPNSGLPTDESIDSVGDVLALAPTANTFVRGGASFTGSAIEFAAGESTPIVLNSFTSVTEPTFGSLVPIGANSYYGETSVGSATTNGFVYTLTRPTDTASQLVFSQPPAAIMAGNSESFAVSVEDSSNNPVSDGSSVTVTLTGPQEQTLTGTDSNGTVSFQTEDLDAAGQYTLTASDYSDGLSGFTENFTVSPGEATKTVFTIGPANGQVGITLPTVVVSTEDFFDNPSTVDLSNPTVTLLLDPISGSGAALEGTLTEPVDSSGNATFSDLSISGSGTFELFATNNQGLPDATSLPFTISASTVVTNLNDSGIGSLRQAIINAQNIGGPQTVTFEQGLTGTIILSSLLELSDSNATVTISGPGSDLLSVSGNDQTMVFQVDSGVTASISGLTITDGNSTDNGGVGGGINDSGNLTLSQSTITGNSTGSRATNGLSTYGGGIAVEIGASLTLTGSIVSDNSSDGGGGGGIASIGGTLSISDSTISGNSGSGVQSDDGGSLTITDSTISGNAGDGLFTGNGTASIFDSTISDSTISDNTGTGIANGGGIFNGSALSITNCTITGNTNNAIPGNIGSGEGGGIYSMGGTAEEGPIGSLTVTNTTISDNSASSGGGIYVEDGDATFFNTIVADNMASDGLTPDISGTLDPVSSFNLIGPGGSSDSGGLLNGNDGNIVLAPGASAGLGTLGGNGGPTQTIALLPGSPAINAGSPNLVPAAIATDQRGSGYARVVDGLLDIGAYQIQPGVPTQLVVNGPQSITAGQNIASVTVDIEDPYGNIVTTDDSEVTLGLDIDPVINGVTTVAAENGVATFTNLSIDGAGVYFLTASDSADGLSGTSASTSTVNPSTPTQLVFKSVPATGIAGTALSDVTVAIEDQFQNVETGDDATISLTSSGTFAAGSTINVAANDGIATFGNLIFDTAGSYTLSATDIADSLGAGPSSAIIINAAAATHFTVSAPLTATAGVPFAFTITALDQFGNIATGYSGTVQFGSTDEQAILPPNSTLTDGTSVVSATLKTAGNQTITGQDITHSITGTSGPISVSPSTSAKLIIVSQPSTGTSGGTLGALSVDIEDQYGNIVKSDDSAVSLEIAAGPTGGTLGGVTSVDASNGVATFNNLTLSPAGNFTLRATDGALSPATSNNITISAAATEKLVFLIPPTSTVAGSIIPIVVLIENAQGQLMLSDHSPVTLSVASGPGALTGTTTVNAILGIAIFLDVSLTKAGTYTIKATDGSDTAVISASLTVSPALPAKLVFASMPVGTTAGSKLSPVVVDVEDRFGNIVTSYTSPVSLSIASGPGGALLGTTSVHAVSGVATFSDLTLDTAGTYTLRAAEDPITAISSSFQISPGTATHISFLVLPSSVQQNKSFTVEVELLDQFGNVATIDVSTLELALVTHPQNSTLSGQLTAAVINGIATFSNLSLNLAGAYSLEATDSNKLLPSIKSSPFFVS